MRSESDALIDSAPSFDDEVSYLPYVEAYLLWRNESWPHPTPCAETFEIAVIMRQIASNYVSGPAYSKAQRRVGLTPGGNTALDPTFLEKQFARIACKAPLSSNRLYERSKADLAEEKQSANMHRCAAAPAS